MTNLLLPLPQKYWSVEMFLDFDLSNKALVLQLFRYSPASQQQILWILLVSIVISDRLTYAKIYIS